LVSFGAHNKHPTPSSHGPTHASESLYPPCPSHTFASPSTHTIWPIGQLGSLSLPVLSGPVLGSLVVAVTSAVVSPVSPVVGVVVAPSVAPPAVSVVPVDGSTVVVGTTSVDPLVAGTVVTPVDSSAGGPGTLLPQPNTANTANFKVKRDMLRLYHAAPGPDTAARR
jgi:hypothetical protein